MELDGHCQSLKLAFEYNGIQHYEEIPHFLRHSRMSLHQQKENDAHKAACCGERGIILLIIPFTDDYDEIEGQVREAAKKQGVSVPMERPVDWKSLPGIYDLGRLREMQELAAEHGGRCLSTAYGGTHTKLLWQCSEGHKPWPAEPNSIRQGHWCPACNGLAPVTIERMHALAAERGGRCLSTVYVNALTKLLWQCGEGHEPWLAKPNDIQQGHWCPTCSRCARGTIEKMHALAAKRGGKCLSTEYVNNHTKLLWQCGEGHETWLAKPNDIQTGYWCPTCARKKKAEAHRKRWAAGEAT
jgi:hypothetical protein